MESPNQLPRVGRQVELDILKRALDAEAGFAPTILLVHDRSGQGKTTLIQIYKQYCKENHIPVSHVDLKGGSKNPIDILRSVLLDFNEFELNRCRLALKRPGFGPSPPEIGRNINVAGRADYHIYHTVLIQQMSLEEQKQWWASSLYALYEDLHQISSSRRQHAVLLLDTFEGAGPDTKLWISEHLIPIANPIRLNNLVIVVAGRDVPPNSAEWGEFSHRIILQPLRLSDWMEFALQVKSGLEPKMIEDVYRKYSGNPYIMALSISVHSQREEIDVRSIF